MAVQETDVQTLPVSFNTQTASLALPQSHLNCQDPPNSGRRKSFLLIQQAEPPPQHVRCTSQPRYPFQEQHGASSAYPQWGGWSFTSHSENPKLHFGALQREGHSFPGCELQPSPGGYGQCREVLRDLMAPRQCWWDVFLEFQSSASRCPRPPLCKGTALG